jgi:dipeptidyl aminopeptidase/acylaminoacyl peptidase
VVRAGASTDDPASHEQLALIDPDGKNVAILLDEPDSFFGDLSWSPDGRYLVFTGYSYQAIGNSEIWLLDVRTGQEQKMLSAGSKARLIP